jgi:hypothetical protein
VNIYQTARRHAPDNNNSHRFEKKMFQMNSVYHNVTNILRYGYTNFA